MHISSLKPKKLPFSHPKKYIPGDYTSVYKKEINQAVSKYFIKLSATPIPMTTDGPEITTTLNSAHREKECYTWMGRMREVASVLVKQKIKTKITAVEDASSYRYKEDKI